MRQAQAMQPVGNGGERLDDDVAGRKRRLDLPQRDPRLARHKGPQVVRMLLQQRAPVAPNLRRCRAAGLAHPLHQLDRRRGAHGKAAGRLTDRAAPFDGPYDPLTKVLGQRRGHDQLHRSHPRNLRIRSFDSMQDQTALASGRPWSATIARSTSSPWGRRWNYTMSTRPRWPRAI